MLTVLCDCPRVELGRTLWRLGDKQSALAELESAMSLDVEDINAHLQKACCPYVPIAESMSCRHV